MVRTRLPVLILLACAPHCAAQPDVHTLESPLLVDPVRLTGPEMFLKAGEQYVSPDLNWIIFQAVPAPAPGEEASDLYAMYVARLVRDDTGRVTGIEEPIRISPPGSANTCGWFHPTRPGHVLWGSTLVPPKIEQRDALAFGEGGRRSRGKYVWTFFEEMDVVEALVPQMVGRTGPVVPQRVFERPNYDAECTWSADGRFVLYAHVRDEPTAGRPDADIWVYDTHTGTHTELVAADGYDGGPFFSPDGTAICYRSDRRLDDHLQIFIADLAFDEAGGITGIEREYQITDNGHVNWAPFWHPSGEFLVYGTSELGHFNYEIMAVETNMAAIRAGADPAEYRRARVTYAAGADVLPAFSPDGRLMVWTAQRGPAPGGARPSTQVWAAQTGPAWTPEALFRSVTRDQALELARAAAGDRFPPALGDAGASVQRTPIDWRITFSDGGREVLVTLTSDGRVVSVDGP